MHQDQVAESTRGEEDIHSDYGWNTQLNLWPKNFQTGDAQPKCRKNMITDKSRGTYTMVTTRIVCMWAKVIHIKAINWSWYQKLHNEEEVESEIMSQPDK